MAELVQRNLELGLADLEPMETSGLCSQKEAVQILQKRSRYEYKLMRKPPQKADFLSYIQYEVYLYMLFAKRKSLHKQRSKDTPYGKIFYSANRIHILFIRALRRFRADIHIWLQYADFCKRIKHYNTLSRCITKAVRIHPRCLGLWSLGAWAALTYDNDTHAARVLLLSGLRVLSTDQHLWIELCRLEILHIYKIKKRQEMLDLDVGDDATNISDEVISEEPYKAARLVYIAASTEVPEDPAFRYKFIQLFREYKGTEHLQDLVYNSLKDDFVSNHIAWRYLATKPVYRYMATHSVEWNVALDQCENEVEPIYEDAVELNPLSPDVWGEYMNWRLECVSVGSVIMRNRRVTSLLTLINRVLEAEVANENLHVSYLKFLRDEGLFEEFNYLLTKLLPDLLVMPNLLQEIGPNLTTENRTFLFTQLTYSTKDSRNLDVYPLQTWNVLLDLHLTPSLAVEQANTLIQALYRLSLTSQDSAIGDLLLKLLTWSSANESAEEFRAKYSTLVLSNAKTWPLQLYLFCSRYETERDPINKQNTDLILEKMISSHGSTYVEAWLEYTRVKQLMKDFSGAGEGYWRAMKHLKPDLVEEFVNRFTSVSRK